MCNLGIAALLLALLGAPPGPPSAGATGATPPRSGAAKDSGPTVVEVLAGHALGLARAVTVGKIPPPPHGFSVKGFWAWDGAAGPRRLEPGKPLPHALEPAKSHLVVSTRGKDACGKGRAPQVIAAPRAMWQEVSESLLPRRPLDKKGRAVFPLAKAEPWRLRLACQGAGSAWVDAAAGAADVSLSFTSAGDWKLTVVSPDGKPVDPAVVELHAASNRLQALGETDRHGRIDFPALPAGLAVLRLASAPGRAVDTMTGQVGSLPRKIVLRPGTTIHGRLVDEKGGPVSGATVKLEGWLRGPVTVYLRPHVKSDKEGRFHFDHLARLNGVLAVEAKGFARRTVDVTAEGPDLDLGTLVLTRAVELTAIVTGPGQRPVAGAEVKAGAGRSAKTDERGRAVFNDLGADQPAELSVQAADYLPLHKRIAPPLPKEVRLVLTRGFIAVGRLVDGNGDPVFSGTVEWKAGPTFSPVDLKDGRFHLVLPPGERIELTFRSPQTAVVERVLDPGRPGERRDLGDIRAPAGVIVEGQVVSARTGAPVAGARVWMPRPRPGGASVAVLLHDLLETTSNETGQFSLSGVAESGGIARVEATGFAPRRVGVPPAEAGDHVKLGVIELETGATLNVEVEKADSDGAQARLDPGGRGENLEVLHAPVVDGRATILNVPSGESTLSVVKVHREICYQPISVAPDADEVDVRCGRGVAVSGTVEVGGEPSGAGILAWSRKALGLGGSAILHQSSPFGARHDEVVGMGHAPVSVAVDDSGAFASNDLSAGAYRVAFLPQGGGRLQPVSVSVPDSDAFQTVLRYAGGVVRGQVRNRDDEPVPGARVEELGSHAVVFSGGDGGFILAGLSPGSVELQARKDSAVSRVAKVTLESGKTPPPVLLVVGEDRNAEVQVTVSDADGNPLAGALVFLQTSAGFRMLTSDGDGRTSTTLNAPLPKRARAAAYGQGRWALGSWVPWKQATAGLSLALPNESGALEVSTDQAQGLATLIAPGAWSLTQLLWRLGAPPEPGPGAPALVSGLPAGNYVVSFADQTRSTTVEAGKTAKVDFRSNP